MIAFSKNGAIRLYSQNSYMFPMNLENKLQLARDFVMNNRRGAEEIADYREILTKLMATKSRLDETDYLHFSATHDDDKLEQSFETSLAASPAAHAERAYHIYRMDLHLRKSAESSN